MKKRKKGERGGAGSNFWHGSSLDVVLMIDCGSIITKSLPAILL